MPVFSLREAAEQVGVAKSSIWRAIKSGRLSAGRTENGGFEIEASELFRVFNPRPAERAKGQPEGQETTAATAAFEAQIAGLKEVADLLRNQLDDTRRDRDHWRSQCERMTPIADQRPAPRRWWGWRAAG
jgi:hypothetical protein